MRRPRIVIVTPYLAAANNGNWHTAARWARLLRARYRVDIAQCWDGAPADALIALHARRSAESIQAFADAYPRRPLCVALTGTDLYGDLARDVASQRSMRLATRLIVLNHCAPRRVPSSVRAKCEVILQSARGLTPAPKPSNELRIAVVGHLRDEKNPRLIWRMLERIPRDIRLRVHHAGAALDPALGRYASEFAARDARYRWIGALSRPRARQLMRRGHLLLHPSRIEGGAAVIGEAITAHTAVVASRIDGTVGLLGEDFPGLFADDDAHDAARLIVALAANPREFDRLRAACDARRDRFSPELEKTAWLRLLERLL